MQRQFSGHICAVKNVSPLACAARAARHSLLIAIHEQRTPLTELHMLYAVRLRTPFIILATKWCTPFATPAFLSITNLRSCFIE
jgi:hypothetical protein